MATVEMSVTEFDMDPKQTIGEQLKFHLQFAILMYNSGRVEMANDSFERMYELIDQLDN